MKRNILLESLTNKKVKDYSYIIAFFILFSFFIGVAIKPNITTAFRLKKQLQELKVIDKNYDDVIRNIVELETALETHREELPLITDALPVNPQVNKVVDDMRNSASASGIVIKKVDIDQVDLKEIQDNKSMKSYTIHMETDAKFENVKKFLDILLSQRRLKMFKAIDISKDTQVSSNSASLHIKFDLESYYL